MDTTLETLAALNRDLTLAVGQLDKARNKQALTSVSIRSELCLEGIRAAARANPDNPGIRPQVRLFSASLNTALIMAQDIEEGQRLRDVITARNDGLMDYLRDHNAQHLQPPATRQPARL